ncbi:type I methionyl aminopeptidase [Gorillibacterium timonense]|uniref:type I methionyl aminopeptidase n=1 Tax=Gorillibacterium timonense TaxID=1689269 RepID=UPI00071C3151|nr:type I methionyl aminopeptidase [Gorillibacterium timonense]
MIILKSDEEIKLMREAGRIVAECHEMLADVIKPGVDTLTLDQLVEEKIRSRGAIPSFKGHQGFPASICVARNEVICHGFPDSNRLMEGDVVTIDLGACYKGYHGDSGWTYAVGEISRERKQLMKVCHQSLLLGIDQAREGKRIGDIGYAIDMNAKKFGYGNVKEFSGHGIGKDIWEEPSVPNYGMKEKGTRLKKGMVIAIEPMFTLGGWRAVIESDGWTARTVDRSICVQFEHTVAITDNGPQILTIL